METSAKAPINVDQAFLQPTQYIWDGLNKNGYDLSSDVICYYRNYNLNI